MFLGTARIGVAVSGGPDSVALLHALEELYPDRKLCVVHLNHSLRGADSDGDEEFVRALAEEHGHPFCLRREDVARAAREEGRNLEDCGRRCRYRFFTELVESEHCEVLATAHTRSDQAETVLFRLLRGAGGRGLSGIWPTLDGGIVRPMLDVTRDQVLEFLRGRSIRWREDRSNRDPRFARTRLRHELLPALRSEWNPALDRALAHTADWAQEEERYWGLRTAELRENCVRERRGALYLDIGALGSLHPAEARRLLRAVLESPPLEARGAGLGHIEALRRILCSDRGSGAVDLPGARVERSFGVLRFTRAGERPVAEYQRELPVPGVAAVGQGGERLVRARLRSVSARSPLYNRAQTALVDWGRVSGALCLRNWRQGDRYRPLGMRAPRSIGDLFQKARVPVWHRREWPVVAAAGGAVPRRIVWARRFGPAHEYSVRPGTRRVLVLDEVAADTRADVA